MERRAQPGLWLLVLLLLAAAGFWAAYWQESAQSALTRVPLLDEAWYLRDGARLRSEGVPGREPFVMSPGYSLLVSLAAPVTVTEQGHLSSHPRPLLVWQAAAWLGSGLLIGAAVRGIGRRAGFGPRPALAAGALALLLFWLYRPAAIYARTILLEISQVFLVTVALTATACWQRPSWRRSLLVGLAIGGAALLRAQVLVLAPLVAGFWARQGKTHRHGLLMAGGLLILSLLPPGLAAWHNSRLSGRLVGPSLNSGLNLYLGQLPTGQGLFTSLLGFDQEWQPSGERFLSERLGQPLAGPAAADAAWREEAWALITADRPRFLRGWLRKTWLHLQGWEIAQVTPLRAWPHESPVLRALIVPYGLLVVLGLVGLTACLAAPGGPGAPGADPRLLRRAAVLWALAAAALIAVQSLFFVVSRYRLALAPIFALLAGCGLLGTLSTWRGPGRRRLLWPALALPLSALLTVPWGLATIRAQWTGLESLNHARRLMIMADAAPDSAAAGGLRRRAESLLAQASAAAGRRQDIWRLRALNLSDGGRHDEALAVLSQGIRLADQPRGLQRQRLVLLREMGRLAEGEALLRAHLQDTPDDGDCWHDLIVLLGRQGRWPEAAAVARQFQAVVPGDHRGWLDLGVALAQLGRLPAAAAVFQEGWERFTDAAIRSQFSANLLLLQEDQAERPPRGAPRALDR